MKKISFSILFLLALVITGMPFIVGLMIKSDANNLFTELNGITGYKAEWQSFDNGWLASNGVLKFGIDSSLLGDSPEIAEFADKLSLELEVEINHGPFLKDYGLGWASWNVKLPDPPIARKYIEWDANKPLYEISGVVNLGGDASYRDSIADFRSPEGSPFAFSFGGYLGSANIANGQFSYKGKSGSFEVSSAIASASIDPILINMNASAGLEQLFSYDLYESSANIIFPNINVQGMESFEMDNLELKTSVTMPGQADLANVSFRYLIDAIEVSDQFIKDFALEMTLENYSAEFNDLYIEFAKELSTSGTTEPDPAAIQEFMLNALPSLIKHGPAFSLDNFAFSLPSGNFSSNARIAIDPVSSMPANLADIAFWMNKVMAEASISADQELISYIGVMALSQKIAASAATPQFELNEETGEFVENTEPLEMTDAEIAEAATAQLQQGLGMLQGMGILALDGATYKSNLKYNHGQTLVNGQEFAVPLGALMGQ